MKSNVVLIIIGTVWLTGCVGPYYYDLHVDSAVNNRSFQSDAVLKVEDVESVQIYWNSGIVIRSTPYKIQHETFKCWAKTPGELVKDAIIHYYRNNSLFRGVVSDYSLMVPDIIMKVKIDAIEMCRIEKKWAARLGLYIEISDAESENVIFTHSFDRYEFIKGRKIEYLPPKISEILEEELVILEGKFKTLLFSE
ncbi:hypothetical protein JXO52_05315 [bacterium]|nr:hypothetical protein [bacterium]